MDRPSEELEPEHDEASRAVRTDPAPAAAPAAAGPRSERELPGDGPLRGRGSMVLWLVVAAAVVLGVILYFRYGPAILPLFDSEP